MRLLRLSLLAIIVLACAAGALADSVSDPTIIIRDPLCPSSGCIQVGTHFTFSAPASGTGVLFFTNASGVNWTSLMLTEIGVPASAINCVTDVFANCSVSSANGITTILLTGVGGNFTGLLTGQNFSIVFGCATGKCDPWPGNLRFTAVANVPEPGAMTLLFTGMGAIMARRRWWKRGV